MYSISSCLIQAPWKSASSAWWAWSRAAFLQGAPQMSSCWGRQWVWKKFKCVSKQRIINELYRIAIRVSTIETPGAVPVIFWRGQNGDIMFFQVSMPLIHLLRCREKKANMIETLLLVGVKVTGRAMQGEIV